MQVAERPLGMKSAAASPRSWSLPLAPSISWESLAYLVIIALALVTRFWDLGSRALHHDESLHAYFSWLYFIGDGYVHDPLLHGPLLYHLVAFAYFLFGDSDATSRYAAAIFGVVLVPMPYLLRGPRFLGRWGALSASVFLLLSPSVLYYSRYIRHDIFTLVLTLLLLVCIVRYIDTPDRRWLIVAGPTIAGLLANHEIWVALLAIFFGYLYAVFAVERVLAWWPRQRTAAQLVVAAHAWAVLGALIVLVVAPHDAIERIFDIPWENPTREAENAYYRSLAGNPLVQGITFVGITALVILIYGLLKAREGQDDDGAPASRLLGDAPDGSIAAGVRALWRDQVGLGVGILTTVVVFAALFTTMFTNLHGLRTATIATDGTLLYWLGQHDVQRGEQPWFYYLVMLPQYDFIGVFFGFGAAIAVLVRAAGAGLRLWSAGRAPVFRSMLAVWLFGIFVGVSYAGEKMPWLITHITVPACLVAGLVVGRGIEALLAERAAGRWGRAEAAVVAALLVCGAGWLGLMGRMTTSAWTSDEYGRLARTVDASHSGSWLLLAIFPLAAFAILGVAVFFRGERRAALAGMTALVVGLLLLQVHSGMRLTYLEGDVPKDMLVYTQTSPDIEMLMGDLDRLSAELTGDKSMVIIYDAGVSWPMQWYLRDFPNKQFIGSSMSVAPNAPVVLIASDSSVSPGVLNGYTATEYVLRWWFPEDEVYRNFAIAPEIGVGRSAWKDPTAPHGPLAVVGSIFDSVATQFTMDGQQRLYRLIMYRDLPGTIGQYRFTLYVRNDLIPLYNSIRY